MNKSYTSIVDCKILTKFRTLEMNFQHLEWDSNFFGFMVGKIYNKTYSDDLSIELNYLKNKGYRLIYLFLDNDMDKFNPILENYKGLFVDQKVTYVKPVKNIETKDNREIIKYDSEIIDENLLKLAVQSGEFSRFKTDKRIDPKKFEELYRMWMINSVQKKIAKEIFIYKEKDILGFVSLGEKNHRADIGLLAVHSSCRGKGIGRNLMISAENWAIKENFKEIQVVTQGNNNNACRFYENCEYNIEKQEFIYHFWLG